MKREINHTITLSITTDKDRDGIFISNRTFTDFYYLDVNSNKEIREAIVDFMKLYERSLCY